MAISPTNILILFTNYDIITYFLNLASCSEHFISIKHRILATFNINQKNQSERLYAFNRPMIEQIILSQEELYDCLLLLDVSNATGPDGISPRPLKYAARELSYPLALLFSKSPRLGVFPSSWKFANVIPVFKNGEREIVYNYRPISLLSIIGKTMKKCIFKHLYNYFNRHSVITILFHARG